ncbi:cyclin-D-binding Myb-like transcription factor 1 [Anneissia japonica]|uniref:cyclin-D-binding Myb-like transcription factor 1 n=1 Tax=Anneissia japonica TaxID=1529436 RepID=UPI001425B463|nr:cyclin-D-binding Myb-like transcription factor 1 [Anneissia japonica]XP_033111282.1 cyclin-D-binding Myb-like transcription factor 1 [Anneissia japonica]XP_033111283.1 cyclin-D-binding Myb-like transcription factor 1 [Anneissia japonica]XP_033111284.1 cyclin-D-binding Myb-like transcription factor 1 [Anneissia japonica]XP_033111285.1 cyclin-D-binding Myb-like transcription factor 1 [Anneissia japonica]XP_033111286.1 cyclin-D-binding Myb-like transcription factor 1 [Anneissia japonica]XP_03
MEGCMDKEASSTIVPLDLSCENLSEDSAKLDPDNSIQYLLVPMDNGGGEMIGYKRKDSSVLNNLVIKKAKVIRVGDQNITVEGLHEVEDTEVAPSSTSVNLSNTIPQFTQEENTFGKNKSFDPITQSWFTSKQSKDNLAEQGHNWKQGVWSLDEIEILKRNIEEYIEIENLSNPQEVIFRMNKDERKGFYRFIAKGLNRPLFAVYRKIIRMYDSKNHVGKYSLEDIEKLKDLHEQYGNDWASIGTEMGRSASSVKDKFRLLKPCSHQGKWSPEEEQLLAESVYELTGAVPGSSVTTGVSWNQVAKQVGTRSEKQCRTKWLNYLNWKKTGGTYWLKEDDDKLIEKLIATAQQVESAINWDDLAQGWRSVRSPQWLRAKWWALKRHVPNHNTLSFQEILARLKSGEVPYGTRPRGDPSVNVNHIDTLTGLSTQIKMSDLIGKSFTLQLPIQFTNQDTNSDPPTITTGDDDLTSPTYHTYEVIPSSMTLTSTNAFFIQSPSSHSSASLSDPSSTDHIIVPTMHNMSATSLSNDNVTVQINQAAHEDLIINTPTSNDEALHSDDIQQEPSVLVHDHPNTNVHMQQGTAGLVHDHSDNADDIVNGQVQLIGTDAVLSQEMSDPSSTLVIVNSGASDLCPSSGAMDETQLTSPVFTLADSF